MAPPTPCTDYIRDIHVLTNITAESHIKTSILQSDMKSSRPVTHEAAWYCGYCTIMALFKLYYKHAYTISYLFV